VPAVATWTPANVITMVRILLVPLVVAALVVDVDGGWRIVAAVLFVVAAVSDRVDGYLARRFDQVTDWGKLVDPIADKLLMGGTMVTLSVLGDLPWWVTVVVLVRELGITALRLAVLRYVVIPASRGGKVKTALQSVGIGLFVLPLDQMPGLVTQVAWVVMVAAVAMTLVTGVDYLRRGWSVSAAARRPAEVPGE